MTKEIIIDYQNNGWLGIFPGRSLLQDVEERFGQPDQSWQLANAKGYSFVSKSIEVIVLDSAKQPIVSSMRILAGCPCENAIPKTLDEANKIFRSLKQIEITESSIIIFEQPGTRVAAELFGDPSKIKWIEFYQQQ